VHVCVCVLYQLVYVYQLREIKAEVCCNIYDTDNVETKNISPGL